MSASPRVSVVVPVRDDPRVDDLLASLAAQRGAPPFEVIVALDGARRQPVVPGRLAARLLPGPSQGPYAARNRAIRAAAGEVVALTDSDCLCPPDWVRRVSDFFDDPSARALQGASLSAEDSRLAGWIQREYERYVSSHARRGFRRFCNTRNFALRRLLAHAMPFPEKFARGGDGAYGVELERAGIAIHYSPEWFILHRHPRSRWSEGRSAFEQGRLGALWEADGYDLFADRPPRGDRSPGVRLVDSLAPHPAAAAAAGAGILAGAAILGAASAITPGEAGYRAFSRARRAAHLAGRLAGASRRTKSRP